ncbi:MAG: prepilin-type cleavage/methylation domain-containing protein [Opitutaceae bacterium]|nr:prepilin-type cleavage/methylation domain-containing protein [Verrucomicrobiales bacterium]
MIVVIIIGLLAAVGIPNFMRSRTKTQREVCVKGLGVIEGAKQQWAIQNKKLRGFPVTVSDIIDYVGNKTMPICPSSGTYTIGSVGTKPTCSIADHVLD